MALKAIIDSIDGLPEDVAKEYTQTEDGQYRLDVEPTGGLELHAPGKLKKALEQERHNAAKAAERAKKFDGLDPSEVREALKKVEEMADWLPADKIDASVKERERQLIAKHKEEMEKAKAESSSLTKELERHLIRGRATAAISKAKGTPELLLPIVSSRMKMQRKDDGKFFVEVVDEDGVGRVGDANGSPMTVEQLVDDLRKDERYARAFDGDNASGAGSGGGVGGSGSRRGSGNIKITESEASNAQTYRNAQKRATDAGVELEIVKG